MSGITPLRITIRARDIDLKNSCNCCPWRSRSARPSSPGTPVFITETGMAIKFDPQKAKDERESLRVSLTHLHTLIEANARAHSRSLDEVRSKIEELAGVTLTPQDPETLNLSFVERINSAINAVFE